MAPPQPRLRVVGGVARHTEDHSDRITQDNPAATGPKSLGAQLDQPVRLGLDIVGA